MSAKQKPDDANEDYNPYFDIDKDSKVEKKVDSLLSIDAPDSAAPESRPVNIPVSTEESAPVISIGPAVSESAADKTSAPLLPSEKLPDLTKKKSIKVTMHDDEKTEIKPIKAVPAAAAPPVADPELMEPIEPAEPAVVPEGPVPQLIKALPQGPKPVAAAVPPPSKQTEIGDDLGLDDVSTGRAVDDIIASEGDQLLDIQDRRGFTETDSQPGAKKPKHKRRVPKFIKVLITLLILGGIGAAAALPSVRYQALNAAGVRAGASVRVLDETTGQPLKNAEFTIGSQTAKTDGEGNAKLEQLKLGKTNMAIKKPAFADFNQSFTLGWGSNPLGEFQMKAVGSQLTFTITDFVSGKPLAKPVLMTRAKSC
jgi:hypothetical protein